MRRRRVGTQNMSKPAIADAPPRPQGVKPDGRATAAVVVEVVFTVRVEAAVAFAATVRVAGVNAQVGRYCAPTGELVRAQVRFMVPE